MIGIGCATVILQGSNKILIKISSQSLSCIKYPWNVNTYLALTRLSVAYCFYRCVSQMFNWVSLKLTGILLFISS